MLDAIIPLVIIGTFAYGMIKKIIISIGIVLLAWLYFVFVGEIHIITLIPFALIILGLAKFRYKLF